MKIGLFDSGLGGLLILKAVAKELSEYDYEYYGDTANVPYGGKTEAEIFELTKSGVAELFRRDCVLVVIACNTASAETLRRLQDEWLPAQYPERKILGVIIPVIEEAVASDCKRIVMLATQRTVSSGKYHLELGKRQAIDIKLEAVATPELVPLIEQSLHNEALEVALRYLTPRIGHIDGVILGCTHYTTLTTDLRRVLGEGVRIFSQTEIIPMKLRQYLERHPEIMSRLSNGQSRNIFLSKHRADYDDIIQTLLEGAMVAE